MIRNIIFDLDGTLLDTTQGIVDSVRYTSKLLGYCDLPEEIIRTFIGPPIQDSFIRYFGCNKEDAQVAANVFRTHYKEVELFNAIPYEGIYDLCETLKHRGIHMAVATYKREDYALKLLCHFGFDRYCNSMHGSDNNNTLKKEDVIRTCIEEMGAKPEDCVLVGDTVHDATGAEKARIPFIAVTYGFGYRTPSDVIGCVIGIANNPIEIAGIIERVNDR